MKSDDNVDQVLKDDGIKYSILEPGHKYENLTKNNIKKIEDELNFNDSWAARVVYNSRFAGVIIKQNPGEGNRLHYHPDADENWVILDGEWEWWIENIGTRRVTKNDIIVVPKNTWHHIKCVGDRPGVRYAITRPDVNHVYEE